MLVCVYGYLAVPTDEISIGWSRALFLFSKDKVIMKRLSFLPLAIITLLAMAILHATNASAKMYMGKIVLEIGETYTVEAVPTSYTASGSFTKSGTNFTITATGSYSCKIRANYVGQGTLSYWGVVAPPNSWSTQTYDMYWDVEVKAAPIKVSSITLSDNSISLAVGAKKQLTATVLPSNATNKSVSWSSNPIDVATVSNGEVIGKSNGTAIITCAANDGSGVKATCTVTVGAQKFKATTIEGVEVLYQVVDEDAKTCRVGFYDKGSGNAPTVAIDNKTTGNITIPERANGYKVVEICERAFWCCESITKVSLPSTIVHIGSEAFYYCKSLTDISGIENVEYIGPEAFYSYPTSPWYSAFPDGAVYIGKVLYDYTGWYGENITYEIKDGTTCITSFPLNANSAYIPKSVKYVGDMKDEYHRLDRSSGHNPFSSVGAIIVSPDNPVFDSRDNCNAVIETRTNTLIAACKQTIIPASVSVIGCGSFSNVSNKDSIDILDGINIVEPFAFYGSSFKYLHIGAGVQTIGEWAFGSMYSLRGITVSANNPNFDSRNDCNAIIDTKTNTLISCSKQTTIPETVKTIGKYGFYGSCPSVITVPDGVEKIESYAIHFSYVKSIIIGRGLKKIESYAFSSGIASDGTVIRCKQSTPPEAGDYLGAVGNATLFVPVGSKSKYANAEGWKKFSNIVEGDGHIEGEYIEGKSKEGHRLNFKILSNTVKTCELVSPVGDPVGELTIPEYVEGYAVTSIKDNAFCEWAGYYLVGRHITTLHLPSTLLSIGKEAFRWCEDLASITGGENVVYVGDNAFNTTYWQSHLPEGETYIGKVLYMFKKGADTTVKIANGTKSITQNAFYWVGNNISGVHSLVKEPFELADGVFSPEVYKKAILYVPIGTKVKYQATKGWKEFSTIVEIADDELMEGEVFTSESSNNLTFRVISMSDKTCEVASCDNETIGKVTIPSVAKGYTVKAIGRSAFSNCEEITEISMPNTIEEIKYDGIYSCGKLTSVSLPSSLKLLDDYALAYNPLTTITIPKAVEKMTGNPLQGDSLLTTISVEEGNTVYESPAGGNCVVEKATKTLIAGCQTTVIPEDIKTIGNSAFYYQRKLREITIPASVDSIKSSAFSSIGLTNIILPEKVRYLGSGSLGYNRITSITIPKSVGKIDGNPLMGDSLLTTITVENGNNAYESPDGSNAIVEKATKMLMAGCQTTVIPNTVKRIGDYAFCGQKKITFMPIPNSVDSIGSYVFYATPLVKVVIPATLKTIADDAFYNYEHTIPVVKSFITNPQALPYSTFSSETYNNGKLIVPQGTKELYGATDYWNRFKNIVEAGPAPTGITLPTTINVVVGERLALEPTFTPENADAELIWSSDDTTIATVSADGVVTGVCVGQTFINVMTDNGKYGWCKVTVTRPLPTAIALPKNATVGVGASVSLTPTFTPEGAGSELTWSVDDESIARVDANGVVTGVSEGLTVITATTSNGIVSNPCKITVTRNADAIQDVNKDSNTISRTYNVSGQRIAAPRKGINIVGGKKVIVK